MNSGWDLAGHLVCSSAEDEAPACLLGLAITIAFSASVSVSRSPRNSAETRRALRSVAETSFT